ncbi:hypothetical protein OG218_26300 [Kineococcus sp. NBC_00420]
MTDGLLPGAAGVLDEHVETSAELARVVGAEVDLVAGALEGEDDASGGRTGAVDVVDQLRGGAGGHRGMVTDVEALKLSISGQEIHPESRSSWIRL